MMTYTTDAVRYEEVYDSITRQWVRVESNSDGAERWFIDGLPVAASCVCQHLATMLRAALASNDGVWQRPWADS